MKKSGLNLHDLIIVFIIYIFAITGYWYGTTTSQKKLEIAEQNLKEAKNQIQFLENKIKDLTVSPAIIPSATPTPTPTIKIKKVTLKTTAPDPAPTEPWGVSRQIGENTWTLKIQMDDRMAEPKEIFEALNAYRQRHQREALEWDQNLADYARSRAQYFTSISKLDNHAGFSEYTKNVENIKRLGFRGLGENSSYGYQMYGVHIIEWVFAGDKPHDDNQLDSKWSHVGVGVDGNQTDIIFGGSKL